VLAFDNVVYLYPQTKSRGSANPPNYILHNE